MVETKMSEAEASDTLQERPYQQQILDVCLKKNTIIYLPTGAGKTFIATSAMKTLAKDLDKPLAEGGKRTIFVVNTVALAMQQKEYIEERTSLKTEVYTGDQNVDAWSNDDWSIEFEKYQVLVATCQIILDIVRHGFLEMKHINLLIFDEAHHAIGDNPMHQLMNHYSQAKESERPRIIGLTGMLLCGNVKAHTMNSLLEKLEATLHATVATESFEEHEAVRQYSTKPSEQIIKFDLMAPSEFQTQIIEIVCKLQQRVADWPNTASVDKKIKRMLDDFLYQLLELGNYGASIAIVTVLIELELMRISSDTRSTKQIVRQCIVYAEQIRGLLMDEMDEIDSAGQILSNSSTKIIYLISLLKKHILLYGPELKALVFVTRRNSARSIYHIIQKCSEFDPEFLIRADFMVGNNSGLPDSIEQKLQNKWNRQVLERFKDNKINVIVTTSVLEEGIDLQMCNLVISYDLPKEFRSYIQSKGRARMTISNYILMCPSEDYAKLLTKLVEWQDIDDKLKIYLIGKTIDRREPLQEDIDNEFADTLIVPFRTRKDAVLERTSAIQLLNRYCQTMPNDMFTNSQVVWKSDETNEGTVVSLILPIQSIVKETIVSDPMPNLKMAKQSAAFKACKLLYKHGELNENLMPMTVKRKFDSLRNVYFEHFEKFEADPKIAGTKKYRRNYDILYPERLMNCAPTIEKTCYLHRLVITPKFRPEKEDFGGNQFFRLLSSGDDLGILTSKELPNLAAMTFFITLGEIHVEVATSTKIELRESNSLERLRNFHASVFTDILQIQIPFLVYDYSNEQNAYFIVPVRNNNICWNLVDDFQSVPQFQQLSEESRAGMTFQEDDYMFRVVSPVYRADQNQRYIVTKIHTDKTPNSAFPNDIHTSYAQYFMEKYYKTVVNSEQFLIEVKGVTQSLNFLTPGDGDCGSRKFISKGPELLVPELCHNYMFPGDLCLKAILIPSILHRLHYLLHADMLRTKIMNYLNVKPIGKYNPKPVLTKMLRRPVLQGASNEDAVTNSIMFPDPNQTPARNLSKNEIVSLNDVLQYPWPEAYEPVNLDRYPTDVYPIDLHYYHGFINMRLKDVAQHKIKSKPSYDTMWPKGNLAVCDAEVDEKSKINLLQIPADGPSIGPEQCDILEALTSSSCGDIFDMERLELIGDSFLKFSVSFYLLQKHSTWHEGFLTSCKGGMVSNRNLCYLAIGKNIPGIININKFNPKNDWTPPLYTLPPIIKEVTKEANMSPNLIDKLKLSAAEIKSGGVEEDTLIEYVEGFLNETLESQNFESTMLQFLGEQRMSDKSVADCVESILGACIVSLGIERCFPLLKWIGVLPDENNRDYKRMLQEPFAEPRLQSNVTNRSINDLLLNCEKIESDLGYKFKDRAHLLQALTHPSFIYNRLTQCYQQLEFLGDAVLDFLISTYIYERCKDMDPGRLTDLRSALVNNITLACVCVRHKFHLNILSQSSMLSEKMNTFYKYQLEQKHVVTDQVLLLIDENDKSMEPLGDFIDVPKVLGDVVEALFGAVFIDSGNNLAQTWKVIYRLMENEIQSFIQNVPIEITRKLYEYPGANPKFEDPVTDGDRVMVAVRFTCKNEVLRVYGFGKNSTTAKKAAAKVAMHNLTNRQ
ncbi:Endoribonuclease Dicer [Pseudolycoriella hygida]|uniref:Endoribonuclease Dicer n=1 Tax=Pseudolycoriella hygida TaxID=35572 RepID=A0A9Q0MUN3_9DIPT|nr:Endoribonuclease Dicer [Pseudolycoriella hygida]